MVGAPISIGFVLARCRTGPESGRAKPIEIGAPTPTLSMPLGVPGLNEFAAREQEFGEFLFARPLASRNTRRSCIKTPGSARKVAFPTCPPPDSCSEMPVFIKESADFVNEIAGFVRENAGFIKEFASFVGEIAGFVSENVDFIKEYADFVKEIAGFVNENPGFVNQRGDLVNGISISNSQNWRFTPRKRLRKAQRRLFCCAEGGSSLRLAA
jgi:hypothetical protein